MRAFNDFNSQKGYTAADIYGTRTAPVTLADPAAELSRIYPNLGTTNNAISEETLRMIQGTDPNLPILAQNTGAARGAALGVPGSQFADRMADLSLYDRRAQQRAQGIAAYNQTIPTISATQTNSPALQAQVQAQNNIWASAPDPAAAAQEALRLYQQQLQQLSGSYSAPRAASVSMPSTGGYSMSNPTPGAGQAPDYSAWLKPTATSSASPQAPQNYQSWFNTFGGGGIDNRSSGSAPLVVEQSNPVSDAWWNMYDFDADQFYKSNPTFNAADWE
jgi:hypothetical protein